MPNSSVSVARATPGSRLSSNTNTSLTPSDSISEIVSDSTATGRSSWVWQYFAQQKINGIMKNVCTAKEGFIDSVSAGSEDPDIPIALCHREMAVDKNSSTKSMIQHLSRCHHIEPPVNTDQHTMTAYFLDGKMGHIKTLNQGNLKAALIRLVVNRELPILVVDTKEFRELMTMVNPQSICLLSKQTCISDGIVERFRSTRNALATHLSSICHISITYDGWTAPSNVAMLGVTAHWISPDFKIHGITLALKTIEGPHTGANLAGLLKHTLDRFDITNRLYSITADNASNNTTMGQHLQTSIPHFKASQDLHGCVAHVINLVAKAGLSVFDFQSTPPPVNALDPTLPHQDHSGVPLFVEPTPHANISSILTRIRGFHKKVKHSSQLKMSLDNAIASCQKLERKVGLIHEVSTRWSSTHASLERFHELKRVIKYQCEGDPSLEQFSLEDKEWDLLSNIVRFLAPLAVVTKSIEGHQYPTFSQVMPDYQWLVERLETAWNGTTCKDLKVAVLPMLRKIILYQTAAQTKAVYICLVILNPRLKTHTVKQPTLESLHWGPEELVDYFTTQAGKFKPVHDPDIEIVEPKEEEFNPDRPHHFIKRRKTGPVEAEVKEYLTAPQEDEVCDVLQFWSTHHHHWPILSRMAAAMRSVPATSAPSESSFSAGLRVMSDHRSSFTPLNLEAQVCLKSWNKVLGIK